MTSTTAPKPLITIIGSLNIDFVTTTPRCPAAGETLIATSLTISPGGKGSNQAVGCGKAAFISPGSQDVDVQMIGAVGANDVYVQKLLFPTLKQSGVGVDGVREVEDGQTGTATIIVETAGGSGENRILVVGGANQDGMSDVQDVLARVGQASGGRDPDVVVMQGEIPRTTTLSLLKHFNRAGKKTKVVFNPAPVFAEGIPLESLKGLAVLVVNETETVLLGQALQKEGFQMADIKSEDDLQSESLLGSIAEQFHELAGIDIVLITLGAKGVYFSKGKSDRKGVMPGVRVEKVVDTTAAGDTFVGYFAASLARHTASGQSEEDFSVREAVQKANAAAAKCVQKAGAMQSIPFGYE